MRIEIVGIGEMNEGLVLGYFWWLY